MTAQTSLFTTQDPDAAVIEAVGLGMHRQSFKHSSLWGELRAEIPWKQYEWSMYGKRGDRPRLECWCHDDPHRGYVFGGGKPVMPAPWGQWMRSVRLQVGMTTGDDFDSCFANLYRNHRDTIDWHADDDAWIGPVIASVSFGASRVMRFRRKLRETGARSLDITLNHGDLLVMPAGTQDVWEHSIPRRSSACGERLNLTFRQTVK